MAKAKGKQKFGGSWTEEKLELVRKYLVAYANIMRKHKFKFAYVDAFAGTGYRENKQTSSTDSMDFLFSDSLTDKEPQEFMDGSAPIALGVKPESIDIFLLKKTRIAFLSSKT